MDTVVNLEVNFVKNDLENKVSGVQVIGCHKKLITYTITKTEYRKLTVSLHYPPNYPNQTLHVELKSKYLSYDILQQISKVCMEELKSQVGHQQVLFATRFLKKLLDESPLLPCKDELNRAKNSFLEDSHTIKLKKKQGIIILDLKKNRYLYKVKIEVPDDYPNKPVVLKPERNNFPASLAYYFVCQAREIARTCTMKPLDVKKREKFSPKPHVYEIMKFLIQDCIKNYPNTACPLCKKQCLPDDPEDVVKNGDHANYVERIYCGHLYHHGCLDTYMKTPPFKGGKKCIVCGKRVAHDKFNISPRIAEQRWAHHEARKREIDEIIDFLK